MNDKLLSIIIPIFNTSQFLKRCIDSILKYNYDFIDIILVNDGSTDNSREICLEYYNKYPNIFKYFEQENKGIASAKNLGLSNVTTPFFTIVDSDDEITNNIYEKCYKLLMEENYDLIVFEYEEITEIENKIITTKSNYYQKNSKLKNNILEPNLNSILSFANWNKIFKTEIFRIYNINFLNIKYVDDAITLQIYLCYVKKFKLLNEIGYKYYKRINSSSIINYNKIITKVTVESVELLINELQIRNLYEKHKDYFFVLIYAYLFISTRSSKQKNIKDKIDYLSKSTETFLKFFNEGIKVYKKYLPVSLRIQLFLLISKRYRLVSFIMDIIYYTPIIKYLKKKQFL